MHNHIAEKEYKIEVYKKEDMVSWHHFSAVLVYIIYL